jgi:hypothetical protein
MNNETKNGTTSPEADDAQPVTPFFARFLEGPRAESGPTTTTNMTLKYPSDRDEIDWVVSPARPS